MAFRGGCIVVLGFSIFLLSVSSEYVRPRPRKTLRILPEKDQDKQTPQQVHISLVGNDRMRISWITDDESTPSVEYGTSSGIYDASATGNTSTYSYVFYKSGQIHDVIIGPLKPETVYFYRCGGFSGKEYSFKTPPSKLPIKFVVVGDLGQTGWTKTTLQHIENSGYDMLLLPGDLSYADSIQSLWDSFGRLIEPLASQRPWMVTQGNHEIEKIFLIAPDSFKAYKARWHMPFEESGSDSNLFYSFEVPSVHVLMLGSYTDFDQGSAQYQWLQSDLAKVDRKRTPWLLAFIHAPWYNTNSAHQGEGEDMRKAMEELLYGARVDVVFAGHVHAYERFAQVYNNQPNNCGPVHITIGDGGNKEGLANKFLDPKPGWSLFREASFGHGQLQVANETHALWTWHRNDDDESVVADQLWLTGLAHTICVPH